MINNFTKTYNVILNFQDFAYVHVN